jgi:hypothetical protein
MSQSFRVEWPIEGEGLDMTLEQLRDVAAGVLPDMLWTAGLVAVGPWVWSVVMSEDGERSWLAAQSPAEAWVDERRDLARRHGLEPRTR